MNCQDLEQGTRYVDYVLKELPPEELEEIEGHLEACVPCRREVGQLQALIADLRSLPPKEPLPEALFIPPPPPAPLPIDPKLRARLAAIPYTEGSGHALRRTSAIERTQRAIGAFLETVGFRLRRLLGVLAPSGSPRTAGPFSRLGLRRLLGVLAPAAALAGLLLVLASPDQMPKGQGTAPGLEQVSASLLRLELAGRWEGKVTRLALETLSDGEIGAVLHAGEPFRASLTSPNHDLSADPWHVAVLALDGQGGLEVLHRTADPVHLSRLRNTARFALPGVLELPPPRADQPRNRRLFVILARSAETLSRVLELAASDTGPGLDPTESLLARFAEVASASGQGPFEALGCTRRDVYEGSILVEVR